MAEPLPTQHFKAPEKKYIVLAVGTDVDPPFTKRVVYIPLYGENAGKVLLRTKAEWESEAKDRLDDRGFWPLPHEPPIFARPKQGDLG